MTPDQEYGVVSEAKAAMELRCEAVRRIHFNHKPSRFQSFFGLASIDEAVAFRNAMRRETGRNGSIWEVEARCIHHRGDMRLLIPERSSEETFRAYWEGLPLDQNQAIWECLAVPPVTMVACLVPLE